MARPKKVIKHKTAEVKPNVVKQEQVSENTVEKTAEVKPNVVIDKKNLTECKVLVSYNDRQEFGGEFHLKGDIVFLEKERLTNAINGRLVETVK